MIHIYIIQIMLIKVFTLYAKKKKKQKKKILFIIVVMYFIFKIL